LELSKQRKKNEWHCNSQQAAREVIIYWSVMVFSNAAAARLLGVTSGCGIGVAIHATAGSPPKREARRKPLWGGGVGTVGARIGAEVAAR